MHDARTVVGGHVVARDDAEGVGRAVDEFVVDFIEGLHPGEQLSVVQAQQVGALEFGDDLIRHHLVALLVVVERQLGSLGLEQCVEALLGHDVDARQTVIGVEGLDGHIVDARSHAQCGVGRQCPRRGGPCQHVEFVESLVGLIEDGLGHRVVAVHDSELCRHGLVFHVAVTPRHVEFVRTQSGASGGRVGLNGISLIKQALVVELLEQPPQGLDITILIGDVGVVHVHPVTHAMGEVFPLMCVFHHLATASGVIVIDTDFLAYVLLGDAECFLHSEFHGQPVRVPPGFAQHLLSQHGVVAAHDVLDGACHHMVNARHAVGTGRSLVKNE